MWIMQRSAGAARPAEAKPEPATSRGTVAQARAVVKGGLDSDGHRRIVDVLVESGRLSYGADRHPLVRFRSAGKTISHRGTADRIRVHARRVFADGHVRSYEATFALYADGSIEEITARR